MINPIFLFEAANLTFMLNIALGALALLIVLYAVVCMLKKALPQIFHFVFFIILMAVTLFTIRPAIDFIAHYDLTAQGIVITLNGTQIQATNVLDTVIECLKVYVGNEADSIIQIALNDKDLTDFIASMAMIIIGYVTFLVGVLSAMFLAKPLGSFIYHVAFKWIFPKAIRKYKFKRRWKNLLIGLTKATVAATLLLSPFTGLINSLNKGLQRNRTDTANIVDQESYNQIMTWVDAYNDSMFAQLAFGVDEDDRSIDMVIMDIAASADYDGERLVFSDQMMTIADAAEKLIAAGILVEGEGGENGFSATALLSKEVVNAIINCFTESDFLMKLLPIIINVALTYAEDAGLFDGQYVDLENADWAEQLKQINNIYSSLYDAGIISKLMEGGDFTIPLDATSRIHIKAAFEAFDNSEVLSTILPAVIYKLVTTPNEDGTPSELAKYLSTSWDDYKSIKWGQELGIIYDTVYQLNEKSILNINDYLFSETSTVEVLEFKRPSGFITIPTLDATQEESNEILDVLLDNFDGVMEILVGYDQNGNEIANRDYETIFDSKILMSSIDKALPELVSSIFNGQGSEEVTSFINKDELLSAINLLNSSTNKTKAYKDEIFHLFKMTKTLLFNENYPEGFDLLNLGETNPLDVPEFKDALIEVSASIENSQILNTCLPTIFESFTKDLTFGEGVPINGSDLNFRNIDWEEEIPILLEGYDAIMDLSSSLSGDDSSAIISNLDTASFATALKSIRKSQILNPDVETGEKPNFEKILDIIFDNDQFKEIGIYPNGGVDYSAVTSWDNEIDAIANIFTKLQADSIVGMLGGGENFDISSLESGDIADLFASIDSSKLLSMTFGHVMDHFIINSLGITDARISFTNVVSWADEGLAFAQIVEDFTALGGDFTSIDFLNSDPDVVEDLLRSFLDMQLFSYVDDNGEEVDLFGEFIHETLLSSGTLNDYMKDYPSGENPTYEMSKSDFVNASWDEEITKFVDVIRAIRSIGSSENPGTTTPGTDGLNVLTSGNLRASYLNRIIEPLCAADSFRVIVFNIIDDALTSGGLIHLDGVNLSKANTPYLLNVTGTERYNELSGLVRILSITENSYDENDALDISQIDVDLLLTTLHESYIFNSVSNETMQNDRTTVHTVFEQIIRYVLSQNGLSDFVLDEGQTADELVMSIYNSRGDSSLSSRDEWEEEIHALATIVNKSSVIDNDFNSDSLISLNTSEFAGLMKSVNHCRLTSNAIPKFFRSANQVIGIESFVSNPNSFDYDLDLVTINGQPLTYEQKITQYDIEIDIFSHVINSFKLDSVDEEGNNQLFDFSSDSMTSFFGEGKSSTEPFFELIFESKIYKPVQGEMLYTLFDKAGMSGYIRGASDIEKQEQINEFFADNYVPNYAVESQAFDKILGNIDQINEIVDAAGVSISIKSFTSNSTLLTKVIRSTYVEENGGITRAYLMSEIIGNLLTDATANEAPSLAWIIDNGLDENLNYIPDFYKLTNNVALQLEGLFDAYAKASEFMGNHTSVEVKENFQASMDLLDRYEPLNGDELSVSSEEYILSDMKSVFFGSYANDDLSYGQIAERIIFFAEYGISLS